MQPLKLAPSILTADLGRLAEEIRAVAPLVDWFHLDVMDGHYVPNLSFGAATVGAVDRACDTPLHVHLMIENPLDHAQAFADAGADRISFHPEVVDDVAKAIGAIRDTGARPGLAIHPDIDVAVAAEHLADLDVLLVMTVRPGFGGQRFLSEVLSKIREARRLVDSAGLDLDIEVDGGVNLDTIDAAVQAGGRILVAGSAVYDGVDPAAAAARLRSRLDELGAGGPA